MRTHFLDVGAPLRADAGQEDFVDQQKSSLKEAPVETGCIALCGPYTSSIVASRLVGLDIAVGQ